MTYSVENYSRILPTAEFLDKFIRPERFIESCKKCDSYGKKWSCPELSFSPRELIGSYRYIDIRSIRIIYDTDQFDELKQMDIHAVKFSSLYIERKKFDAMLLAEEMKRENSLAIYCSTCVLCDKGGCTRANGEPCKHLETMRYSMEALGCDVVSLLKELFDVEIHWEINKVLPDYYTLAGGILFD